MLLKRRMAPTSAGNGDTAPLATHLVLGTLSAVVGHPINGYLPMPDWVTVQTDSSTREPPKEEPRSLTRGGPTGDVKSGGGGNANEFYSGSSSPEYSSRSDSEEDSDGYDTSSSGSEGSESESESTSEEGSGADSESVSESGDEGDESEGSSSGSRSDSEESSSYDSESSSPSSQGEEGVGLLIMGPGATSSAGTSYGASAPAPHSQDLTGLVEKMSVADREDSASPQPGPRVDRLNLSSLSMVGVRGPAAGLVGVGGGGGSVSSMAGVVGAPPVLGRAGSSTLSQQSMVDPELDTSVSFPSTLLRHQAGGGLQVEYRYTRGRTDMISRPTTVLTLRLTLSNHRDTPVRRIKVVAPRDGTPMNAFLEVQVLGVGATVDVNLGIDFGGRAKEVSFCYLHF